MKGFEAELSDELLTGLNMMAGNTIIAIEQDDCGALVNLKSAPRQANKIAQTIEFSFVEITKLNTSLKTATEGFQRQLISQILTEENGNFSAAARRLSTDRANLNRMAKRLNIKVIKSVLNE
ncbi:MAG: hypothetical protein HRT51_19705 [Colwellia sp.]|nr:hypothetical protein [Colwellia sp.]